MPENSKHMGADAFRNSTQGSTPDSSPSCWHWPPQVPDDGKAKPDAARNEQAGGGGVLPAQQGPQGFGDASWYWQRLQEASRVGEQKELQSPGTLMCFPVII